MKITDAVNYYDFYYIIRDLDMVCASARYFGWVKMGKFGQQVNSDIRLQTVEIQMRQLLMNRLIRIFNV